MDANHFHNDKFEMSAKIVHALRIALLVLVLVPLTSCISLGPPRVDKPEPGKNDDSLVVEYGRELVQQLMKKYDVPGLSVVLVDREKVLWAEGFGWASKQNSQPLTADSVMQMGSITKIFTAIAIMQLVEKGKVDLEAKLTTYLPEFRIQSRFTESDFSIRQMLSHHSGLPSDLALGFRFYLGEQSTPDDLLAQFENVPSALNSSHMASQPGEAFSYSNLAYSLLGTVIARTSGDKYADYIVEHILSPLEMKDSAILLPEHVSHLALANGFTEEGEIEGSYLRDLSAGALAASANDMGKFLQLFLNNGNAVLSDNSLQLMSTAQNDDVELDGDFRFGLSFFMSGLGQEPFLIYHGGDIPPYHATLRILPREGLGIVMMVNSDLGGGVINYASSQILDVAYRSRFSTDPELATPERLPSRGISLSEEQAENYTGLYYAGTSLGFVDIENKGSELTLEFLNTGIATVKMVPLEDDKFDIKLRLFGFIPLSLNFVMFGAEVPHFQLQFAEIKGKSYFWLTADGVSGPLALPVERSAIPEAWLERIGTYRVAERNEAFFESAELSFNDKSGFLQITVKNDPQPPLRFPIQTISDDQASILGIGRFGGEIIDAFPNRTIRYGGITLERE